MPRKKLKDWEVLLKALCAQGHRWEDIWHLLGVVLAYVFSDRFKSPRRWLVYIMYYANWLDLKQTSYNNLTDKDLADITDCNLKLTVNQEAVHSLLGTSANTYKKNFANYLNIPKQPKVGTLLLIVLNKWQDSERKLAKPITQKQLASLDGMYHKKIAKMFVEVPQAQNYLKDNKLPFKKVRHFPPRLIEYFFEEIGEPERFNELVKQIRKNKDLDINL